MADDQLHIGENSPEYVAYRLMDRILNAEGKYGSDQTREDILSTYATCLKTVRAGNVPK